MPMLRLFGGTVDPAGGVEDDVVPEADVARRSAVSSPAMQRRVVVFPQPLGPSSTRNSPDATSRSRSSTAVVGGFPCHCLVNPRMRRSDM